MKQFSTRTQLLASMMAGVILFSSCASTTRIESEPPGARLYLDGARVGSTPYYMTDTKIVGTCTSVRMEKEGYEDFHTFICRNEEVDVGAVIGGVFVWFPFLWTMKYRPAHLYELTPASEDSYESSESIEKEEEMGEEPGVQSSKAERLREMKALYDDGILTEEEYKREKQKILNEE